MNKGKITIGIDPGSSSGALAIHDTAVFGVSCIHMPDDPAGIYGCLSAYQHKYGVDHTHIVCEDVGTSMPGNAARAASTFAKHRGHLEMAFVVLGAPVTWVRPAKWMKELLGDYPKGMDNKALRKEWIYEKMQKEYPDLKVLKRHSDALAILTWYLKKGEVKNADV